MNVSTAEWGVTTTDISSLWIKNVSGRGNDTRQLQNITDRVISSDGTELDGVDINPSLPPDYVYIIMFKYVAPIVIFSGTFGNILSLFVLQSKHFKRAPSSFILSALALTDTGVLWCGLMRHWLNVLTDFELDIRALTQGTCKVHYFFTYYLPQLSSWSLALLTIERMSSVKWPFKAKELFSKKRMITFWTITALCLAAINAHCFKTLHLVKVEYLSGNDTVHYYSCDDLEETLSFNKYAWPWIDLVLICIFPITVIITCNIVIVVMLLKARKMRKGQMQVTGSEDDSNSITAMLIGISIMFFFFTTPVSIYFIGVHYWPQDTLQQLFSTYTAYSVVNIAYYLSNSTNFLVYCISGAKFRRTLVAVLCCREIQKPIGSTASKYGTSMTEMKRDQTRVTAVSEVNTVA